MEPADRNANPQPTPESPRALWFLVFCSVAAVAVAAALCASLLARQGPPWLVVAAGLAVFPLLPLVWHGLAEIGGKSGAAASLTWRSRLALRTLAVALVVLGVSFGNLGPKQVGRHLWDLASFVRAKSETRPPAPAAPVPLPGAVTSHGLESFIPADATLVVGLAGSTAVEQLLAAHGVDTRDKLAALSTCKIDFSNARVLVAARGRGTQMIVVRASGITDERNLYCLVGVMGPDRLQIRSDGTGDTKTLRVSGFLSRALTFRLLDQSTVMATDEAWQDTVNQRLFATDGTSAQGQLAQPLLRVDRSAPLWVASVDETPQGAWDLAIDSRQEGNLFKLQGSATPPAGEQDRAQFSVRVPLAFARALPESAVALGIRGVVAAVVAVSAGHSQALPPPPPPPVVPPPPAGSSPGAN